MIFNMIFIGIHKLACDLFPSLNCSHEQFDSGFLLLYERDRLKCPCDLQLLSVKKPQNIHTMPHVLEVQVAI